MTPSYVEAITPLEREFFLLQHMEFEKEKSKEMSKGDNSKGISIPQSSLLGDLSEDL